MDDNPSETHCGCGVETSSNTTTEMLTSGIGIGIPLYPLQFTINVILQCTAS